LYTAFVGSSKEKSNFTYLLCGWKNSKAL